MKKFAFIGAGSFAFTRNLIRDILTFPAFEDAQFALMDTDPDRLERITAAANKIISAMGKPATVLSTTDRIEALKDADGVLCTVFNGDIDVWRYDIEVPMKYGVSMNVGDTRSVAGIFRACRNIPLMLDICKDIETYCPNAVFLNYTNPMAMLCKAMQEYSNVEVTGLCHSVQKTIKQIAGWVNVPVDEIDYLCAGINHMAFYLHLKHGNTDLYPLLRKSMEDPKIYNEEIVRNEMFKNLGYYVTESSGHASEYNAWFRKRPDLIEKYCTHGTGWNPGLHAYSLNLRLERKDHWREEIDKWINEEKVQPQKSTEYASDIFNARFGDGKPFIFNGNVINEGCITNLPSETCVEIPVVADKFGFKKTFVGELPKHLATFIGTTAGIENLVVEGAMEKNREKIIRAVMLDPLSSAVCSMAEIREMCDILFEKNKDFLGDYK